jgi:hypothetical protein
MDWLLWLENSELAQMVRQSFYPLIQIVHILSFSMLFGAVAIFDLGLLGYVPYLPVLNIAKSLLRLAHLSFGVVLVSGWLLFSAQPTVLVINPAFQLKLFLIALAGVNAAVFHLGLLNPMKLWKPNLIVPSARLIAILSLIIWSAIIACGRMIAYV